MEKRQEMKTNKYIKNVLKKNAQKEKKNMHLKEMNKDEKEKWENQARKSKKKQEHWKGLEFRSDLQVCKKTKNIMKTE